MFILGKSYKKSKIFFLYFLLDTKEHKQSRQSNEEDYFKSQGVKNVKREDIVERYKVMAENDVKWYLIKDAILKKEDIQVSEETLKELAEKDAEKTGISAEKMFNYYKNSGQNEKLLDQKLFDFLKEKNNIKKVDPEILAKREKGKK